MRMRTYLVGLGLLAGLGCSDNSTINPVPIETTTTGSTGTTAGASTGSSGGTTGTSNNVTVVARGTQFSPSQMTITAGQTVTWRNDDTMPHTVTSGTVTAPTGLFDHQLGPGESFSFTFPDAGSFDYFCRFHVSLGMVGSVTVQPATGGAATTTTTGGTTSGGSTGTSAGTTTGTSGTTPGY